MAYQDQIVSIGGGAQVTEKALTYSGSYERRFALYGEALYMELELWTSGTLVIPAGLSYACDIWGIGGGGGSDGTAGGGSGYTALATGLSLSGSIAVEIGQGAEGNGRGGSTTVGTLFTAEGGYPGLSYNGGNGGSGGGSASGKGGVNGGDGSVGTAGYIPGSGAGFIMARFRDATQNHNYAKAPSLLAGSGGGGYGDSVSRVRKDVSTLVAIGGGFGTGASQATYGGSGNAFTQAAMPGLCVIRFPID